MTFRTNSADPTLRGLAFCRAQASVIDSWLAGLLADAAQGARGLALVAIGGYGRRELCPGSDLDVVLLHARGETPAEVAQRLWYPIWDEGLRLGHHAGTVRQILRKAEDTLELATALLSVRHLAGDASLTNQLAERAAAAWRGRSNRWLATLGQAVEARHARFGEAAFQLEPDLKEAHGALRDVHALAWVESANALALDLDHASLAAASGVLLDARVELHRLTGRPGNVLTMQDSDAVAAALGCSSTELMAAISSAARHIAWTSDDVWRRVAAVRSGPAGRGGQRPRLLSPGVVLVDGEVTLEAAVPADAAAAMAVAAGAAHHGGLVARRTLTRLAEHAAPQSGPWPEGMSRALIEVLAAGPPAVPVVEALDHFGIWARAIPEWQRVRCLPQRNPYHRYTVDRHLLETAARAAALVERVSRPDLLLLGALLHDVGKGGDGDHSALGADQARVLAARMGLPEPDIETLAFLVGNHLLLADTAVRRDLDDPGTIEQVAGVVASVERLHLLAALTEADSRATGPSAWSSAKAALLATLVRGVEGFLGPDGTWGPAESSQDPPLSPPLPPGAPTRTAAAGEVLTVVARDAPGVFCRVAGTLALHGLDVLAASATSSGSTALSEFRVAGHDLAARWPAVVGDVECALDGRLALSARLAERAQLYDHPERPRLPVPVSVRFDNAVSSVATVVDVRADDGVGVLFRITRAFAELLLDIRSARVQTMGHEVVDAFYLVGRDGLKLTDPQLLREIELAVVHAVGSP